MIVGQVRHSCRVAVSGLVASLCLMAHPWPTIDDQLDLDSVNLSPPFLWYYRSQEASPYAIC